MDIDMDDSQHRPPSVKPAGNATVVSEDGEEMLVEGSTNGEGGPLIGGFVSAQDTVQDEQIEVRMDNHDDNIMEGGHDDAQDSVQGDVLNDTQGDFADDFENNTQMIVSEDDCDVSPDHDYQHATERPDERMAQASEDNPDIIYESIEHETVLQPESFLPAARHASVANQDERHDTRLESETMPSKRIHDIIEPQDRAELTHGQWGMIDEQPQQQPDGDSLFIPERASPVHQSPPRQTTPAIRGPPSRQPKTPSAASKSTFAMIRNMQKTLADKKKATQKQAAAYKYSANPDNEAYLAAVMAPITPSSSTPRPAVDKEEMAERLANAEFLRQKRHYDELKRKNGGNLTFREDVEWMKIKGQEDARRRKRKRDLEKAREDGEVESDLFPEARPRFDDDDEDDELDNASAFGALPGSRKRRRGEMPRKEPKQMSMQEAELQSMRVALEAAEDLPKKKGKGPVADSKSQDAPTNVKGKASKPRSKATTKSKATSKAAPSGGRKTAKGKRELDHAVKQASSLFNANVFEQQAGAEGAEQPTFRSRRKGDALKELIASVPLEDQKNARSDMAALAAATRDFDGHGAVRAHHGNWLLRGMTTSLKGYQLLGGSFMRRRENAAEEPLGGLMADQMGLGKTLMMLANIVNGLPPKGHRPRTTLLVASPALLGQWSKEISQHTNVGLRVMRYGAGNRIDSNNSFEILESQDIILTTYSEVMKSYPKNEPPIEYQTAEEKMEWWKSVYEQRRGVLHRMQFLRIVLDEAQAIKNHLARTSIACRALMAKHRWALSGTPIMNSLTELYPYFKFLGVPHTGSFKIFKQNYCDTKSVENTERLLLRLSQFMIRRTHADQMFNAPILKLPQADQSTFTVEFNPVERRIYDIVHERFANRINAMQSTGELEKSYSNALVMLLRLRQLTAHVLMLQLVMRDLLEVSDIERIREVVNEEAADSSTRRGRTITAIRKQLEKHAIDEKKKAAAERARIAAGKEVEEGPSQSTAQVGAGDGGSGKSFGKDYNFKPFLKSLKSGDSWEKAKKAAKCSWCNKQPKRPLIASPCGHMICEATCWEFSAIEAAEVGKAQAPCKMCGVTPSHYIPFEAEEDDFFEGVAEGTRSKTARKSAKQKERRDREDISSDWLALAGNDVLPSAKTMAIKAQIMNWRREDPKVKIIVYTQFLAMVKIMSKIFQLEGWSVEQYVGTMSLPARDKAITIFAEDEDVNILVASLRCGGLGLNLTMASRVIMVDPWWNEASEQQAFCRVFRIGQKEETYMSRFCVRNTVDDKLMAMQKRKREEINEVMEDGGKRTKGMSIRDLMRLFGNLNEDATGKPFIMVDNPDPRGGYRADRDDEGYADEF